MPVGLPYNNWNPRPVKNGQPPPCNLPTCNQTFAGRKVGAAMKRLPNIQMGMKAKDQILQKWDPVSKTLVNIYKPSPLLITSVNISRVGDTSALGINWSVNVIFCNDNPVKSTVDIYRSTSPNTVSGTKIQTIQTTGYSYILTNPAINYYYYAIVTLENGSSMVSNVYDYQLYITTVAGNGTTAVLNNPSGVAVDSAGNIYIADLGNNRIRKVTAYTGVITTVAGTGTSGFGGDGGPATTASINYPAGVAVDSAGNIYIADTNNNRIRKVTGGTITTVAGSGSPGFSGDGGSATTAELSNPTAVFVDSAGNIYIADTANNRIRKVTGGTITTVAGNGSDSFGGDGGPATTASINYPGGVAVDSAGNIYIADTNNTRIRKVTGGTITTVAGSGSPGFSGDGDSATAASLTYPSSVSVDSAGNIYIADTNNSSIRKVTASTGIISTVAGNQNGDFSGDGGPATTASISYPAGVAVDSAGNIYIADRENQRIRKCYYT